MQLQDQHIVRKRSVIDVCKILRVHFYFGLVYFPFFMTAAGSGKHKYKIL